MRVNKNLIFLLSIGLLSPSALSADLFDLGDVSIDDSSSRSSSSSSTSVGHGTVRPGHRGSSDGISDDQCRENIQKSGMLSMKELKYLNGGKLPSITAHSGSKFKLEFSKFASKCAKLEVNRILDKSNNHIVQFLNKKVYSAEDLGIKSGDKDVAKFMTEEVDEAAATKLYIESLTMQNKIGLCLKSKEYITKTESGYSMNPSNSKFDYSRSYLDIQKDMNSKHSSRLLFASPQTDNNTYKEYPETTIDDPNGKWACTKVQGYGVQEDESNKNFVFKSQYDKEWDRARVACNDAVKGDIYSIKRLIDKDTGNRSELQEKIREVYSKLLSDGIDEKASDLREKIQKKLTKLGKYTNPKKNKAKVAKLKRELNSLIKQYDSEIIKPSKEVLSRSIERYEELGDSEADEIKREKIEDRMGKINSTLEEFEELDMTDAIEAMKIHKMTSTGKKLLEASTSSSNLARVCLDCDDQMDMEDAEENIAKRLKKFDKKDKGVWSGVAKAARGSQAPIYLAQKRYYSTQQSMGKQNQMFQQKEQKMIKGACEKSWYGSMKNPIRCQQIMQGQSMRYKMHESRMNGMQADLQGYNEQISYFGSYRDAYLRSQDSGRDVASSSNYSPIDQFGILSSQNRTSDPSIMYNMQTPQFAQQLMR